MRLDEISVNQPTMKNDLDAKAWIVYNSDGSEYSRHQYPGLWNSSPASNAAKADLKKLQDTEYKSRPLSANEQKYIDLDKKFKKLMAFLKSAKTNPAHTDPTSIRHAEKFSKEWNDILTKLANDQSDPIRDEILAGTYKPVQ